MSTQTDALTARTSHVKLVTWPDKEVDVLHKVCSLARQILLWVICVNKDIQKYSGQRTLAGAAK